MKLMTVINIVLYIYISHRVKQPHEWDISLIVSHIGKYPLSSSAKNLFYFSSASTKDRDVSAGKFTRKKPLALYTRLISIVWLWRLLDSWSLQWRRYQYSFKLSDRYIVFIIVREYHLLIFLGVLIPRSLIHISYALL